MADRLPLVMVSGRVRQLPSGDTVNNGVRGHVFMWGADSISKDTAIRYMRPGWTDAVLSSTEDYALVVPCDGTLKNLYVRHGLAAGNGNNVVYTVMKNGVAQTITVTLATNAVGSASDTTHAVAVVAGDRISIKITKATQIANGTQSATVSLQMVA